jgi:hypothetical protein
MPQNKRRPPARKLTVLLACIENAGDGLASLTGESPGGRTERRWAVATGFELHVGEPGDGADEVLRAFLQKTHRHDGLRNNERLERRAEPMCRQAFEVALGELKRKATR